MLHTDPTGCMLGDGGAGDGGWGLHTRPPGCSPGCSPVRTGGVRVYTRVSVLAAALRCRRWERGDHGLPPNERGGRGGRGRGAAAVRPLPAGDAVDRVSVHQLSCRGHRLPPVPRPHDHGRARRPPRVPGPRAVPPSRVAPCHTRADPDPAAGRRSHGPRSR